ncbi:hypothetical protein IE53DRAFT_308051, partial [Violaceomyces palustris]
ADLMAPAPGEDEGDAGGKRRRVQRACDMCRKKKVRCDGLQPEKGACSNCANYGHECTFVDAARKRAPPRSYVDALEARMEKMEKLLESLAPGMDFTDRIGPPVRRPDDNRDRDQSQGEKLDIHKQGSSNSDPLPVSMTPTLSKGSPYSGPSTETLRAYLPWNMARSGGNAFADSPRSNTGVEGEDSEHSSDEDDGIAFIQTSIARTSINSSPETDVLSNSGEVLAAVGGEANGSVKDDFSRGPDATSSNQGEPGSRRFIGKASDLHLIPLLEKISNSGRKDSSLLPESMRPEFWLVDTGFFKEDKIDITGMSIPWPEPDLEELLLTAYFGRVNKEWPILNEFVFRQELQQPELRLNADWLGVALGVFAVACLYVDDPRARDGQGGVGLPAGLRWWDAKRKVSARGVGATVHIHKLQSLMLDIHYLMGTPLAATMAWGMLAVLLRLLQDLGTHRRATAKCLGLSRVEEETRKRLFWVCYSLDRELSAGLGRPMMIQDEDMDIEPPLEMDDNILCAGPDAVQPKDKPADVSGFISNLKLDEIIGRTLRTIYAIGKAKTRRGFVGRQWDQFIVAEIDSSLNNWLDTMPEHLRYNPNEPNDEWLIQSSLLHTRYYHSQILVHRPFIPGPKSTSPLNFPSLAICTNAARSISHVVDNLRKRNLHLISGITLAFRSFSAGTILLMVVWGAKRSGGRTSSSAMADVRKCLDVLHDMEKRWQIAGKLYDMLNAMVRSSELPVPAIESDHGTKRRRDEDTAKESPPSSPRSRKTAHGKTQSKQASSPKSARAVSKGDICSENENRQTQGTIAGKADDDSQDSRGSAIIDGPLPLSTYQLAFSAMSSSSSDDSPARDSPNATGVPAA